MPSYLDVSSLHNEAVNFKNALAGFLLVITAIGAAATERIALYTYYPDPPFAAGSEDSFTDTLAAWLTERSAGKYAFVPTQVPRRRLEMMVKDPHWTGIVAWANPLWFGKDAEQRYSWTRPYMLDANLVVSLRANPVDFTSDQSLAGHKLGTVLGYTYPDLDLALRSGALSKEDSLSEFSNLLKLKGGRVDVAFLQASSVTYFKKKLPDFEAWAYLASKPRTVFTRRLFIRPGQPELLDFLNAQMSALVADKTWRKRFGTCDVFAKDVSEGLCK